MQALVNEQEKSVKTAIGQVIGVLLRHEFPENGWPELMQFIQQMTLNENVQDKEVGSANIILDSKHTLTYYEDCP